MLGNWSVQVIPLQDIKEHETNFPENCPCKVRFDDKTGVITHNAFDKRQDFEVIEGGDEDGGCI